MGVVVALGVDHQRASTPCIFSATSALSSLSLAVADERGDVVVGVVTAVGADEPVADALRRRQLRQFFFIAKIGISVWPTGFQLGDVRGAPGAGGAVRLSAAPRAGARRCRARLPAMTVPPGRADAPLDCGVPPHPLFASLPLARLLDPPRTRCGVRGGRSLTDAGAAARPTRPGAQALRFHVLRWLGGATEVRAAARAEDAAAGRRRAAGQRARAAVAAARRRPTRPHAGRPGRARGAPAHPGCGRRSSMRCCVASCASATRWSPPPSTSRSAPTTIRCGGSTGSSTTGRRIGRCCCTRPTVTRR